MRMFKVLLFITLLSSLTGCASFHKAKTETVYHQTSYSTTTQQRVTYIPTYDESYLEQGKRYFEEGYFKRAKHMLLPLACDGVPEAQYAIGYMYYYGYGVAQDTEVGYFWIQRAAENGFPAAIQALSIISRDKDSEFRLKDKLKQ